MFPLVSWPHMCLSAKEIAAIALLGTKICWYCPDCSVGASTLHKQTKLLNDALNTLDSEVSLLKSQQSATTQNLTTANQNIAANKVEIKSNSTRITSNKNEIINIQDTMTEQMWISIFLCISSYNFCTPKILIFTIILLDIVKTYINNIAKECIICIARKENN